MEVIEYNSANQESGYTRSTTPDFVRSTITQVSDVVVKGLQPLVGAIRDGS